MSAEVDHVTDAEIVNFDEAQARQTLREVEAALKDWIGSTVHLADLVHRASVNSCWRVDEDYRAGLASGAIAPQKRGDGSTDQGRTWLGWKFNRGARTVRELGDYGELRAIIAADPALLQIAEPEFVARPMRKLLRPKLLGKEVADQGARDEAIRRAWQLAVERAEGNSRDAIAEVLRPVVLKQIEYRPIRRLVEKLPPGEKARIRREKIARASRQFLQRGHDLINLGAVDSFDAALVEPLRGEGTVAALVIELLDEGVECLGPAGGRWHYQVSIDGEEWKRGDVFYVRDRHGVPRLISFQYVLNGRIVCYSRQRFRRPTGGPSQHCGYTDRFVPSRSAMTLSEDELEVQQLAADLLDVGEDVEAERLLDVFATTGDSDEIDKAKRRALRIIDDKNESPL